jgi:hypothetical protein
LDLVVASIAICAWQQFFPDSSVLCAPEWPFDRVFSSSSSSNNNNSNSSSSSSALCAPE